MDLTLAEQGVRNSATVMVILIQDTGGGNLQDWNITYYKLQNFALVVEALKIVAEQRRMLDQTRADAERLSGRDSHKDDYFLQVADQSGKSLDLPQEEKTSLIIAMSLHEKGRTAMKK